MRKFFLSKEVNRRNRWEKTITACSPLTNRRGVALLIVLLIITLISVLIFEFNYETRVNLIKTQNRANLLKSLYIAKSGINGAKAVLEKDSADYDGLDEAWAQEIPGLPFGDGILQVKVTDEGGKFNVNNLVKNNGRVDDISLKVLKRLMEEIGLDDSLADDVVELLKEKEESSYKIDDLSEFLDIEKVNIEHLVLLEKVMTTHSNSKVNINTAPYEVIVSLSDSIDSSMAEDLMTQRIEEPFKSKGDVKKVPGFDDKILLTFSPLIDVKSDTFTIFSQGVVKGIGQSLASTIVREGNDIKVVKWKEL